MSEYSSICWGFPGGSDSEESACNVGDLGSSSGLGRSPGEENGNPRQYSCLENFMDRRVGHDWATLKFKKKKISICCPVTNRLPDVSLPETGLFGIKKDCNLSLQPWWATGKSHGVREGECFYREEKEVGFRKPRVHGFSLAEFLTGKERSLYCPGLCYQCRTWELPLWFPNSIWLTLLLIHFLYIEYIYATHMHIWGHKESDLVYHTHTHTHTHGLQRVRLSGWTTSICLIVLSICVLMSWLL